MAASVAIAEHGRDRPRHVGPSPHQIGEPGEMRRCVRQRQFANFVEQFMLIGKVAIQNATQPNAGRAILFLDPRIRLPGGSEEHTSELQSLMRISSAVFCLTKKKKQY